MKDKYTKNNGKSDITMEQALVFAVIDEALNYANVKEHDTVIDIDTHKFYEHCKRKFFNRVVERNCKFQGLERHYMEYTTQLKFLDAMSHLTLYDVEKLRLLELAERFIKEYKDYLNK